MKTLGEAHSSKLRIPSWVPLPHPHRLGGPIPSVLLPNQWSDHSENTWTVSGCASRRPGGSWRWNPTREAGAGRRSIPGWGGGRAPGKFCRRLWEREPRRPLSAGSRRKCEAGSCVICRRPPGAWWASLRSAELLPWLPVGQAWPLRAQQMKLPKFQTTSGTGFGASTASPPTGMTSGGKRDPGARSLSGPSRALCVPLDFPSSGLVNPIFFTSPTSWPLCGSGCALLRSLIGRISVLLKHSFQSPGCLENLLRGPWGRGRQQTGFLPLDKCLIGLCAWPCSY